jgi:glucokinase
MGRDGRAGADVSDERENGAIGFDVGGTFLKGVAVDRTGAILVKRRKKIGDDTISHAVWSMATDGISQVLLRKSVGIAAPGIVSPDGRSIWWMQGRRQDVQGMDWSAQFPDHYRPVHVINDAQAALLGEVWQGAAKGCRNVVLLTLGTGVGGAAMVDGHLLRGHLGRAGHLGHICLDPHRPPDIVNTPGSLEDAIGECSIERRSGGRFESTEQLLAAGDEHAQKIWSDSIRALACGVTSLINVLDPEVVILGGGMIAAGERLFAPLNAELDRMEWRPHGRRVKIVPAAAGEYAGALGAAYHAMQQST